MTAPSRPWGTSGRVTLTRRVGHGLVVDVRVDQTDVGVVWRVALGWRAAHLDPVEGLDPRDVRNLDAGVRAVLARTHPDLAGE